MLLGQAPWVVQWLTPIWILSIGVTLGLIGLVALGGLFWLLSRIPVIGELGTDRNRRTRATWIGTAIAAPIYLAFVYPIVSKAWGVADKGPNVLLGCILLAPLCYMIPRSLVMLVTRRNVREFPETLREGALWPILWVALGFTLFTGLGITVVRNPGEYLKALQRWATLSTITKTYRIEPRPAEAIGDTYQEIQISFRRNELASMSFQSTENVEVRSRPVDEDLTLNSRVIDITSRSREQWAPNPMALRQIFSAETIDTLYVLNRGSTAADLSVSVELRPAIPEIVIIPFAAGSVMAVFLLYFVQRATMPRMSAVALATLKSELAQPLFLIVIILGVVSLVAFIVVPGNTFGEDIKILKDSGLTLIKILAMFQAIWAASVSVSEEIEGRTALTVLSKPIDRRSFILGKFLGISWTVALVFIILGSVFLLTVAYKPIYDAREGSIDDPTWQSCYWEMTRVIPGLVLSFMETLVLAAISVAISTRLPMMGNFTICFTIYVLGNLAPMLVQTSETQFPIVRFFAQLIATIFPNLESFNTYAAIAGGRDVPLEYLGGAGLYCLIFTLISMLLALLLFEDRDLA